MKMKKKDIARRFIRTPSLILTYLGFAGNVFVTTAFLSWLPTYFQRMYDLPMEKASVKASIVMLLAIVGALSDRYGIQVAMTVLPVFCVIAAILFLTGSFFYEKDLSKVEKIVLISESEDEQSTIAQPVS